MVLVENTATPQAISQATKHLTPGMRRRKGKINVEMTKRLRSGISYQRPSAPIHARASRVLEIADGVINGLDSAMIRPGGMSEEVVGTDTPHHCPMAKISGRSAMIFGQRLSVLVSGNETATGIPSEGQQQQ